MPRQQAGPNPFMLRRYQKVVDDLFADPEATGDLLLIGVYLARMVHLKIGGTTSGDLVRAVFGEETRPNHARYRRAMESDIRRYSVEADPDSGSTPGRVPCGAPMVRRATCGKPSTTWGLVFRCEDGRRRVVGGCTSHQGWARVEMQRARVEWESLGEHQPVPAANAGGVLARHLPQIAWGEFWASLKPGWVAPPEGGPTGWPRLMLVLGDAEELSAPVGGLHIVAPCSMAVE